MENNKITFIKKLVAFIMAAILVFSMGITPAFAAEGDYIAAVGNTLYQS